jgi:hypothetical protein
MSDHLPQTQHNSFGGDFSPPQQLRGEIAKWDKEHGWHDSDGVALPSPMLVIGTDTLLIRWHPQFEDIRAKPLPSAGMLNSAIPRSEWRVGLNGEPEDPWKLNYEIRMIDPAGGKLHTFRNSTYGARLCWERLNEAVFIARTLRGSAVLPLVQLAKRPMPTQRGLQSRPHLEPIEYREPRGGAPQLPSQPTPQLPPAATVAASPVAPVEAAAPAAPPVSAAAATVTDTTKPVEPIRMEEVINNQLPPWA